MESSWAEGLTLTIDLFVTLLAINAEVLEETVVALVRTPNALRPAGSIACRTVLNAISVLENVPTFAMNANTIDGAG